MADITFNQADARFKHKLNLNYNERSLSAQWSCECVCKKGDMEVDHIEIALRDWNSPNEDFTADAFSKLKLERGKKSPYNIVLRNPETVKFGDIAVRFKCKGCGSKREFHINNDEWMAFFHERAWGNGHDIGEDK